MYVAEIFLFGLSICVILLDGAKDGIGAESLVISNSSLAPGQ